MKVFRTQLPTPCVYVDTDHGTFQVMPFAKPGYHAILKEDWEHGEFSIGGVDDLSDEDVELLMTTAKTALEK